MLLALPLLRSNRQFSLLIIAHFLVRKFWESVLYLYSVRFKLIVFYNLTTSLLDNMYVLKGVLRYWSLLGVKGLTTWGKFSVCDRTRLPEEYILRHVTLNQYWLVSGVKTCTCSLGAGFKRVYGRDFICVNQSYSSFHCRVILLGNKVLITVETLVSFNLQLFNGLY